MKKRIGQTANFSVTADGALPLYYQWHYYTNTVLTGETNTTLTLNNVRLSDAGMYSVTSTNSFGSTNSSFASLSVSTVPNSKHFGYASVRSPITGGGNTTNVVIVTDLAGFIAAASTDPIGLNPPPYAYTLDEAADIKRLVTTHAGAGKGPFAP